MPSWMIDRFAVWDSSCQRWSASESRAIMLDLNDTTLCVTDLETMRQLATHTLSRQITRCVIKGMWMAFQYKMSMQSAVEKFQLMFQTTAACLEAFDIVKSLVPCQMLPEGSSQASACKSAGTEKPIPSSFVQPSAVQQMQSAQTSQQVASQKQRPAVRQLEQQKLGPEQRHTLEHQPSESTMPLYAQQQVLHHQQFLQALTENRQESSPSSHPLSQTQPLTFTQPIPPPEPYQHQQQQHPDCEVPTQLPIIDGARIHQILHDPSFPAIVAHIDSILCTMFT